MLDADFNELVDAARPPAARGDVVDILGRGVDLAARRPTRS